MGESIQVRLPAGLAENATIENKFKARPECLPGRPRRW